MVLEALMWDVIMQWQLRILGQVNNAAAGKTNLLNLQVARLHIAELQQSNTIPNLANC